MRIVYGSPRYSEDLDFNSSLDEDGHTAPWKLLQGNLNTLASRPNLRIRECQGRVVVLL